MKTFFIAIICTIICMPAYSACTASTKTYTACKPGYYLSSGQCLQCPLVCSSTYGTSPSTNTGDISSCYATSGTSCTDLSGTYEYTSNCSY